MKDRVLLKFIATILTVVLGGIVLHAPISVFLESRFPDIELVAKSWKEILLGVVVVAETVLLTRRKMWRQVLDDLVIKLIAAYAALHVVLAVLIGGGAVSLMAGLVIDLRYVLIFALIWVLLRVAPEFRRWLLGAFVVGAVVVVGFGFLQLFLPNDVLKHIGYSQQTIAPYLTVDDNDDYVRINSTMRGPNPLGAYMVMIVAVLAGVATRRYNILSGKQWLAGSLFGLFSLVVLWVTYSRSTVIGAFIAVAAVVLLGMRIPKKYIASVVVALFIAVVGLFSARDNAFVANVVFHDDPTTGAVVTSDDARIDSVTDGVKRMLAQPLGGGVGSTGSASILGEETVVIENQYLFIAHESGWLGLGLFLAIFGLVMQRLYIYRKSILSLATFASGAGLAVIGLMQPVWIDDAVSLVWWALAAIALAGATGVKKQKKRSS